MCLFADRLSTDEMKGNQLRLYFSALAYTLMEALRRLGLKGTAWAETQVDTIRLKLLKIGAIARSDTGKDMPNYSYLLGAMVSGAISNAYYPHADRGANLVFTNAFIGIAGRAGGNVLQEFLGKRLTRHVPADPTP
jgi:Transposase DDE domain group 1